MAKALNKKIMTAIVVLAVLGTVGSPFAAYAATDSDNTLITATVGSTITVASTTNAVGLTLTPGAQPVLTSASDTVTVNTNNAAGYNLTIADSDATLTLTSGGNTIAAHAGTPGAPTALATNTWGWAVGGLGTFDGTYSIEANATSSATKWAGISATPYNIKSTATTATNDVTTVWFAAKVDSSKPNGAYTDTVTYTATTK